MLTELIVKYAEVKLGFKRGQIEEKTPSFAYANFSAILGPFFQLVM